MFDTRFECANDSGALMGLVGKRILIAGSCGPLAQAIAEALSRHGARLVLHAPDGADEPTLPGTGDRSEILALGEALRARGTDFRMLGCDFGSPESIRRFVEAAGKAFGGLDIVVTLSDCDFGSADTDIEAMVADALRGPHHVHAAWERTATTHFDGKTLIHAVTVTGCDDARGFAGYTVFKGALDAMTAVQNDDGAEARFRVHALAADCEDTRALRELSDAVCRLANAPDRWLSGKTLAVAGARN